MKYSKWEEAAIKEASQRLSLHPSEIEVCENGQVHIKNSFILTEPNFIIPFEEEEYD